jgi:hypothetical protein
MALRTAILAAAAWQGAMAAYTPEYVFTTPTLELL